MSQPVEAKGNSATVVSLQDSAASPDQPFASPGAKASDYTDSRPPGDWQSRYPKEARRGINVEACVLGLMFLVWVVLSGLFLGMAGTVLRIPMGWLGQATDNPTLVLVVDFRLLMTFAVGGLGGTTFSIKWLIHSAAKCKWHLDRRYWRFFVPVIGGVYACVVLTLMDGGLMGDHSTQTRAIAVTAALAFLVGYFSDGVSGLLSNIANAVFGTLEKK